jgi:hypothetical protein
MDGAVKYQSGRAGADKEARAVQHPHIPGDTLQLDEEGSQLQHQQPLLMHVKELLYGQDSLELTSRWLSQAFPSSRIVTTHHQTLCSSIQPT